MATSEDATMMHDYEEWKGMGEGGTSYTWAGYLSNLNAEKTIAFSDTLTPALYRNPERYAAGWLKASSAQKTAASTSFLKERLPEREGPRSRAKKFVFPQRERNAADPIDERIKDVSHLSEQ